ncbi:hypothetical protein G5B37_12230 [Rasiella rasia]|uniref:Lipoprotein n=1 Tax=Rasiella rasia TaxID=2744027 RepID=A0A6G6GPA3_9FLAO|nr:hypothetical protein [Rasiella rasia]QIE60300.1 hypothetical protein G5B37_12230 [Rasiella rasia]
MKTKIFLGLIAIVLFATGCKTTIPAMDSIDPTFFFKVTDVDDIELDENFSDSNVVYLMRNETFNILFSGKDQGGVQEVRWTLPNNDVVEVVNDLPGNWEEVPGSLSTRTFRNQGDMSDPRSSILYGGQIIPRGNTLGVQDVIFTFTITDFNGNTTTKPITIRINPDRTEIGPR